MRLPHPADSRSVGDKTAAMRDERPPWRGKPHPQTQQFKQQDDDMISL